MHRDKGSRETTRSGEEQHLWEVTYHRTGAEAAGEEVGAVGTPECRVDTPQHMVRWRALMRHGMALLPLVCSPGDTGKYL